MVVKLFWCVFLVVCYSLYKKNIFFLYDLIVIQIIWWFFCFVFVFLPPVSFHNCETILVCFSCCVTLCINDITFEPERGIMKAHLCRERTGFSNTRE